MSTSLASTSAAIESVSTAISPKGVAKADDEGAAIPRMGTKCGGPINSTRSKALSGRGDCGEGARCHGTGIHVARVWHDHADEARISGLFGLGHEAFDCVLKLLRSSWIEASGHGRRPFA